MTAIDDLRAARDEALSLIYASEFGSEGHKAAVAEYEKALEGIVRFYGGPDMTPAHEDMGMFEVFHNVYKSDNNVRPRGDWSLTEMRDYLQRRKS